MECLMCGIPLEKSEVLVCCSCGAFIDWKYGSLEKYQKALDKALKSELEGDKK